MGKISWLRRPWPSTSPPRLLAATRALIRRQLPLGQPPAGQLPAGQLVLFDRRSNAEPTEARTRFESAETAGGRQILVLRG